MLLFKILATCPSQKSKNKLHKNIIENNRELPLIRNKLLNIIKTNDKLVIKLGEILNNASNLDTGRHINEMNQINTLL